VATIKKEIVLKDVQNVVKSHVKNALLVGVPVGVAVQINNI